LRSSNLSHLKRTGKRAHAAKRNNAVRFTKLGSVIVTSIIILTAVVVPSITLIQNVEAVTSKKNIVFSAGDNSDFSAAITGAGNNEDKNSEKAEPEETKAVKETQPETVKSVKKAKKAKPETEPEKVTETAQTSEAVSVAKNVGSLSTANVDTSYSPKYVELSSYDRDKLERLVMGEAGALGYNGAALVAQAIRDTMNETGSSSIDYIINEYQYTGSTENEPTSAVKSAVSDIFDNNGYAVQHRILYFYSPELVDSQWHESQEFIIEYGTERFFDSWD
jgi:spore germination cell wall hydrolase CwlJ-like protein